MSKLNNIDKLRDLVGRTEYHKLHDCNLQKGKSEECDITHLLINPYNRSIDKNKVERIKQEINRSGEIYPVVYSEIDNDGKKAKMVVDGHHRLQALRDLDYKKVPIVQSDSRGIKTKASKQSVEKVKRVKRFNIGDKILYYNVKAGVWDSGVVTNIQVGGNYQIVGADNRSRLINIKDLQSPTDLRSE